MTKKSPETLTAICQTIASGITSYAKAARMNDVGVNTFWDWIKNSQRGDEDLIVEYLGQSVPFAVAVHAARRIALHEMRGRMEQKSILGYDEPIFYNGMPTWKPDPACVGMDEETREMLGYPKDGLLRDENGCTIQNTVHHEPPIALQLRVAEMAFPKEYRPGVNQSVDVNHSGVVGIQHPKPVNYQAGPPPVPAAPVPPQLTFAPDADPELDELLGPDPVDDNLVDVVPEADDRNVTVADAALAEPAPTPVDVPVPSTLVALGIAETPKRVPRTALEADLFAKLETVRNKPKD